MLVRAVTYPPSSNYPFYITAKRYWLPQFEANVDEDALTLVVLHSTSFHKETWEPSIAQIFRTASQPGNKLKIREAWAIDCPNHGASALLNERALMQPEFANDFTCEKYAQAAHRFLSSEVIVDGIRVDFRRRHLIGIGHSLGANALILLQNLPVPFRFSFLVIVEPLVSAAGPQHLTNLRQVLINDAKKRRDVWPTREHALKHFQSKGKTARWDPRILELFVQYAIRPHPAGNFTLSCTRQQEIAMYSDKEGGTKPVTVLTKVCAHIPIHLIIGNIFDYISPEVHTALVDPNSGRRFASVTTIEDVGHLIPQEAPDKLGNVIYNILSGRPPSPRL